MRLLAVVFVWGVWAVMTAAAAWFVATFGSEIPWADDWSFHVPHVSGERQANREWLLERFGEFPTPLSRILLFYFCRWFGFHGELYTHVAILGALSAALILTARYVRGETSFADAFFPLLLLHFGSDNFIWESQLVNFLPSVLACSLLMMVACWGLRLPLPMAVCAGLLLLGLALSGPAGLVYVPGMSLWLCGVTAHCWITAKESSEYGTARSFSAGVTAVIVVGLILAANQFMGYCLVESQKALPGQFRDKAELRDTLKTSVQLLSMSFGNVSEYWKLTGLLVVALVVMSATILLIEWMLRPPERGRALGLFLFIASGVLLVVGTGRARGVFPEPRGLQNHYVPHVVPILIAVFFVFTKYSTAGVRQIIQYTLMLLTLIMLPFSTEQGLRMGRRIRNGSDAFEADIRAGKPPAVLAERHSRFFFDLKPEEYKGWEENLTSHIRGLQRAGIGVFRDVADPAFREVRFPIDPIAVHNATWQNGVLRTMDANSFIAFTLPAPTFVYGIRVKYSYVESDPDGHVAFRAEWTLGDQPFSKAERIELDPDPQLWGPTWKGEGVLTVWVNDTIDRLRLFPRDTAGYFRLIEMTLLLPMNRYALGTRISATDPINAGYFGDGWHDADGSARATAARAEIAFELASAELESESKKPRPFRFRLRAIPFGPQRLVVRVNGHDLIDRELSANTSEPIDVDIPPDVLTERNTITLLLPRAQSPRSLDGSDDDRVLGLAVEWWELTPLP